MFCLFLVNLNRCQLHKVICHYPKEGAGVVNAQPIVITIFVTTRGEGEGGRRGRANVTIYGVFFVDGIPYQTLPSRTSSGVVMARVGMSAGF